MPPLHRLSLVSIDTKRERPPVSDDESDSEDDVPLSQLILKVKGSPDSNEPSSKKPRNTEIWTKFQEFISDLKNKIFVSPEDYNYFNEESMKRILKEYDQFKGMLDDTQASEVLEWIYQLGRKEFIRMAHQNADLIKGQEHAVLPRPASREWWIRGEETDPLLLERDENGYVVVDLWHARVGHKKVDLYGEVTPKPMSFNGFTKGQPTFFMESKTYMMKHWDQIVSYVCPDADERQEDLQIYIKCGRFKFKPLLWFDDTSVEEVLKDVERKQLLAKLIDSNAANKNYDDNKSIEDMDLEAWKKATYKSAKEGLDNVLGPELRIDNNCIGAGDHVQEVQAVEAVLKAGFAGTLCVDVSGPGAAFTAPHRAGTSSGNNDARAAEGTRSIVLWDVPGTLEHDMTDWIPVSDPCDPDFLAA